MVSNKNELNQSTSNQVLGLFSEKDMPLQIDAPESNPLLVDMENSALSKLEKAYDKDKKNADILNYLGFALRKTGDFEKAEKFYLEGLKIDAAHLGINEYLGELYVQTNRIELAKERLQVLNGCNCEEYTELKELIEKN